MNILIPHSWLLQYLKTETSPKIIGELLSLSGPSVDSVTRKEKDWIYDIEVTTNRIEMFSVMGVAREAVTILNHQGKKARLINNLYQKETPSGFRVGDQVEYLNLQLKTPLCSRFSAVLIENVELKPSPKKAQRLLQLSGHRPINNLVDVSNWLMHAYGQPVHVFDYDQIKQQKMTLRLSKKGEKITTLDGKTFKLPGGDIVIEDGEGRLIDLCGVMGEANSAVNKNTKRVLLFVQKYDPQSVRQTSLKLPQRTVAAQIFEKDPDPEAVLPVLFEGIRLIQDWAGGHPEKKVLDVYPSPMKLKPAELKWEKMDSYLNYQVKKDEAVNILKNLGFKVKTTDQGLTAVAPSWQAKDVHRDVDLIEEIARIWGYNNFDSLLPVGEIPQTDPHQKFELEYQTKVALKYLGYTELYSPPLISAEVAELFGGKKQHLRLANPLGKEWEYLRTSLLPALLGAVEGNQQLAPLNLFELAPVFLSRKKGQLPKEQLRLTLVTHQNHEKLLGHLTALMNEWGIKPGLKTKDTERLAPGRSGVILSAEKEIGTLGQLSQTLIEAHRLSRPVWVLDFNLDLVKKLAKKTISMKPILKYQAIIEDITLVRPPQTPIGPILEMIKSSSRLVKEVKLIDAWEQTVTLRIEFNSQARQLTQIQVNQEKDKILSKLKKKFKVSLKVS